MNEVPADRWHIRAFLWLGYTTLFLLLFGLGAWAAVARISGAVIASGSVEVEGNRQVIQHPTGGVIEAINVRDGDTVVKGDVLIELEGDALVSELGIVEGQWYEVLARQSRLTAERDDQPEIVFDPDFLERAADDPAVSQLMAEQEVQFSSRRKMQEQEEAQLTEREIQISEQIEGLEALKAATNTQADLLSKEIEGQEALLAQGLTEITRVLTPQRELARLRGQAGQVEASIAENRGKIAETGIERVRIVSKVREAAISDLRDLEFREIELRERRLALIDEIDRLDLRAPVSGIVYGSTADTVRGVISPAEPILYIIPQDIPLVVRAQIDAIHIDQVHLGQEAVLRFSSFDQRTTPEVTGHVISISADIFEDERRGLRFYRADIRLDEDAREKLSTVTIQPGMPVEAFIQTSDRSAISYFIKPLSDYFVKAFREG